MSFADHGNVLDKVQPEWALGGFSKHDGTIEFYSRVRSVVGADSVVVDLGAGRGAWFEDDTSRFRRDMRTLKGSVREVIGCDIDPAVLENRSVDRAVVVAPGGPLPFADSSVDAIVADYVLEHVTDPAAFALECKRVLKPGGMLCARTPTWANYVSIGARLVDNYHHSKVLGWIQPGRKQEDVFPTAYLLNTKRAVGRTFGSAFENLSYVYSFEPQYFFGNAWVYRLMSLLHWLLPDSLHGNLFVFLRKR